MITTKKLTNVTIVFVISLYPLKFASNSFFFLTKRMEFRFSIVQNVRSKEPSITRVMNEFFKLEFKRPIRMPSRLKCLFLMFLFMMNLRTLRTKYSNRMTGTIGMMMELELSK